MRRLELPRARRLARWNKSMPTRRMPWQMLRNPMFNWAWQDPDVNPWLTYWEAAQVAASLALDGYPARWPRKPRPRSPRP